MPMTPLDALLALNSSWEKVVPNDQAINDITLVSIEGKLSFRKVSPYNLFQKGDFSNTLKEAKALFGKVQNPQEELLLLEKRINALGKNMYMRKECCFLLQLFFSRKLSDFQVEYAALKVLPEVASISQGLPNKSFTLCWLNSMMIYLAATRQYDALLSTPQQVELEPLRKALFNMVASLRNNDASPIIDQRHQEIIVALKESSFQDLLQGRQEDANEFLQLLEARFQTEKFEDALAQSVTIYRGGEGTEVGTFKEGKQNPLTTRIMVRPSDEGEIDIEACITQSTVTPGIKSYCLVEGDTQQSIHCQAGRPVDFVSQDYCIRLPDHLELYIKRGKFYLAGSENGLVSLQKIKLGPHATIQLTEHSPSYTAVRGKQVIYEAVAQTKVTYQIVCAIERIGDEASHGHYIAHVREPDGSVTSYSDTSVKKNQPETVWEQGYLVQLKALHREPV